MPPCPLGSIRSPLWLSNWTGKNTSKHYINSPHWQHRLIIIDLSTSEFTKCPTWHHCMRCQSFFHTPLIKSCVAIPTGSQAKEVACQTVRDLPDNLDCALAVLKVVCTKAKGYQVCHRHCNLPRVQHYSVSKLVFVVPHQNSQLIQHIKELLCVLKG